MAAVTYQERPRHLRLVTANEPAVRRVADLTMLRRRLTAVAVVVALFLGLGLALGRAGGERGGLVVEREAAATLPIAQQEYVVQPGDTLWKIARALQPEGDVRPLVYQLGKARDGAPLRVGERIPMP